MPTHRARGDTSLKLSTEKLETMPDVSTRALVEIFLGVLALTVGTVFTLYYALVTNQQLTPINIEYLLLIMAFGILLTLGGVLRRRGDIRRTAKIN